MVTVEIKNQQKKIPLSPARISRIVNAILSRERIRRANLSIVFVTDQKIRALNKKYLHRMYATDVLAFDLRDRKSASALEGEIVISTGAACRQARQFKTTPQREVTLYVVHGILHLLGYDDHRPADIRKMRSKEKELMELL